MVETVVNKGGEREMSLGTRYDIKDVAKMYHKNPATIRRWVRTNQIPCIKIGKEYLFPESLLKKWEKEHTILPNVHKSTQK